MTAESIDAGERIEVVDTGEGWRLITDATRTRRPVEITEAEARDLILRRRLRLLDHGDAFERWGGL